MLQMQFEATQEAIELQKKSILKSDRYQSIVEMTNESVSESDKTNHKSKIEEEKHQSDRPSIIDSHNSDLEEHKAPQIEERKLDNQFTHKRGNSDQPKSSRHQLNEI